MGERDDAEFEAVMRMKMEPLVLTEAEADAFEELMRRRSKPVGTPLPIAAARVRNDS